MRNPRRFLISMLLIDVLIFAGVVIFELPQILDDPDRNFILAAILFGFLLMFGIPFFIFRPMIREQTIREKGQPAVGRLLKFWDTGTTINDNPQVGMLVELHLPGGAPYQAQTKTVISRLSIQNLKVGAEMNVRVNPAKPQDVAFVDFISSPWDEVGEERPQPESVLDTRLAELDELRRRSMISETDYQRRRTELLKG